MALVKAFADSSGNTNPQAYWRAVGINIDSAGNRIGLVFYGYKDAASFGSGLAPLPGAVKSYQVSGPDYGAVAGQAPSGATLYEVLANACETYALGRKDIPDGQGGTVSFFEGAQRVS